MSYATRGLGFSAITSLSAAAGLGALPANAAAALIRASGKSVRWRDDGTDPDASTGMLLEIGEVLCYGGDLSAIKFIETAASAALSVAFYPSLDAIPEITPKAADVTAHIDTLEANTDEVEARIGAPGETAPATDTASSGMNGRLQRIAQRLTSLIGAGFTGPATATRTSVDSVTTAGGVTILAANAARRGATIANTDANPLYLMFAAAGSVAATDFDVKLLQDETLQLAPGEYTGVIAGIWSADGSGAAKVCEFT